MNSLFNIKLVDLIKVSIVIVFLSFVASCTKTEDDDAVIDDREKFIGTWNCSETSSLNGNTTPFIVTISRHTNTTQIIINNFYSQGENVSAIIAGNSITTPKQLICEGTEVENGSGSYNNEKINMSYKIKIGADYDNCTAIFTKIQ